MNDRTLLEIIAEALNEIRLSSELSEIGGKDTLTYYFDEDAPLAPRDCSISVTHFENESVALQILISVFYELDDELKPHIERLLKPLNSLLSIGCFCLMPEGYLYLKDAFLIDDMAEEEMLISLAVDLELLTATAARSRELLLPLVNGEISPNEIEEDAFCISQLS